MGRMVSNKKWLIHSPECSTWQLAQVSQPRGRGAISTKNVIYPIQGAQFWLKMSFFQPRGQEFDQICPIYNPGGHNFNQKCHIANTCDMILAKFIIKYILNT